MINKHKNLCFYLLKLSSIVTISKLTAFNFGYSRIGKIKDRKI